VTLLLHDDANPMMTVWCVNVAGYNEWVDHGHMAWIDACSHAVLSAKVLLDMHKVVRDSGAQVRGMWRGGSCEAAG
jgi:hypothetical protein